MRLVRFMSEKEFHKYLSGEKLVNRTDWRHLRQRSTSVGFCFFPLESGDDSPEKIMHYLFGAMSGSPEVCCVFETSVPLRKGYGTYRDPTKDNFLDFLRNPFSPVPMMRKTEYSTESYSRRTFQLIRAGHVSLDAFSWKINWIDYGGSYGKSGIY